MRTRSTLPLPLIVATVVALPAPATAQILASEHGSVSQTVDGTTMTVDYYRPVARGREGLFGKVVRWGETWTPGANWATTLEVSKDVKLNGQPLPKGKYALWFVTKQDSDWTLIVSKNARVYHTMPPKDTKDDQLRFTVKPEQAAAPLEVLTWSFPAVMPDGAQLRMQWGTTSVPLRINVQPTRPVVLSAADRALYVGKYEVTFDGPPGQPPEKVQIELFDTPNGIRGRFSQPDPGMDPEFDLLPAGPRRFHPGMYQGGKFVGVEMDWTFVFNVAGGRVTGIDMLGETDQLIGKGKPVR